MAVPLGEAPSAMKRWSVGDDIMPVTLQGNGLHQGLPAPSPALTTSQQQNPLSPRNSASICDACAHHKFPAIKAAASGHFRCLQLLHHAGRVLNVQDASGATPLHSAVGNGHLNCALWLVDRTGADLTAKDNTGAMPAHHAAYHGQLVCLKWLSSESGGKAAVVNATDGSVPAHFAATRGHLDVLRWLTTEAHANPNDVDDNGTTPLYYAAQEGHLPVVQWLLETQDSNPLQASHDGMTPLHAAAQAGRLACTKYLVKAGKKRPSRIKDGDGATPVHFAAVKGHSDVLAYFLAEAGATGDERDEIGATPVHDAAEQGQLEALKVLLYHGATIDPTDSDNLTPRQLAVENGHSACAAFLQAALERRTCKVRERDWQDAQRRAADNPQDEAELMAVLEDLGTSLDGTKPESPSMQRTKRSNQTSNASPRLNERAQSPEPLVMPGDERLAKPKTERRRATPSPVPIDPSMPRM
eukprot:m.36415 g.36415  ORF g.36415 m.36415 type:complete len:470 (+) comp12471_c0_seq1:209-1618(+)